MGGADQGWDFGCRLSSLCPSDFAVLGGGTGFVANADFNAPWGFREGRLEY